jgi:hypothetical protein
MRFGKWRDVSLAITVAAILVLEGISTVQADGWHLHYTIPREVPAYDYSTGGPYYAPPVPYGHYAKDPLGDAAKAAGTVHGYLKELWDTSMCLFHECLGGCGGGCGLGKTCGEGRKCVACGGTGTLGSSSCGFCLGLGLFHQGGGGSLGGLGGSGTRLGNVDCIGLASNNGLGLGFEGKQKSFAPYHPMAVTATSQAEPAGQAVVQPTGQSLCGLPDCKILGRHSHPNDLLNKIRCKLCGGGGCGACGGMGIGDPCNGCGGLGQGCDLCGGCGLFRNGLGFGHGGTGCGLCGGAGCSNCLAGVSSRVHGLLGSITSLASRLHQPKFDWFVGAGGPVPLTPGYVPYIVTTRSPRDFFAFPPRNPNDP